MKSNALSGRIAAGHTLPIAFHDASFVKKWKKRSASFAMT